MGSNVSIYLSDDMLALLDADQSLVNSSHEIILGCFFKVFLDFFCLLGYLSCGFLDLFFHFVFNVGHNSDSLLK